MNYPIDKKFEFRKTFTHEDSRLFANLSGDTNPIHLDAEYASHTRFKKPIVHGALTSSLFSTIFGTIYPGQNSIYISQSTKFLKPVYFEQEVIAEVVLQHVDEKRIGTFLTQCSDTLGNILLTGEAKILLP